VKRLGLSGGPKSYLLVLIQFAALFGLAFTGPIIARNPLLLVIELLGLALGVWAIVAMRFFNFNVTPDVKVDGFMVEAGPYRWIRHPMYAALILIGAALVAEPFSWLRLLIWLILVFDLIIKLHYEEGLLQRHYPAYAAYMTRTKRLIPFIY
jgi:protein-S-isoprenylcysteine O-methyltransferase Ste14